MANALGGRAFAQVPAVSARPFHSWWKRSGGPYLAPTSLIIDHRPSTTHPYYHVDIARISRTLSSIKQNPHHHRWGFCFVSSHGGFVLSWRLTSLVL